MHTYIHYLKTYYSDSETTKTSKFIKIENFHRYKAFSLRKLKNSNFAVFKIVNNFILGIQFLANILAKKKLRTTKVPRNTPKVLLFASKIRQNSNMAVFEIAYHFILGIQFIAHRLATKKIGNS